MSMSEAAMKRNSNYHTIWEKQLSIFFKYDVSTYWGAAEATLIVLI